MSGGGAHAAARAALLAAALLAAALLPVALLPVARAQDGLMHPGDKPKAPPPPITATHPTAFPGLQPFARSKNWAKLSDHFARAGLSDDSVASIGQELEVIRMQNGLVEREAAIDPTRAPPEQQLGLKVGAERRQWLWLVPLVLERVERLWNTAEWDAEQLAQAQAAGRFFGQQEGPPKLSFVAGKHAENQQQLERLMAWYKAEVARPESYALMLITGDRGPWKPMDANAASSLKELAAAPLDAQRRLVLRRDEKAGGPWLLQLVSGKKPAWTRSLPQVSEQAAASFAGEPLALGEHGWVVRLTEGEQGPVELYLDAKGQPLFYFTSW